MEDEGGQTAPKAPPSFSKFMFRPPSASQVRHKPQEKHAGGGRTQLWIHVVRLMSRPLLNKCGVCLLSSGNFEFEDKERVLKSPKEP